MVTNDNGEAEENLGSVSQEVLSNVELEIEQSI